MTFFLDCSKVLLMSRSDVGHHTNRRLNHGPQGLHFVGLRNARFEYAHLRVRIEQPYAERNAHLRVIRTW